MSMFFGFNNDYLKNFREDIELRLKLVALMKMKRRYKRAVIIRTVYSIFMFTMSSLLLILFAFVFQTFYVVEYIPIGVGYWIAIHMWKIRKS